MKRKIKLLPGEYWWGGASKNAIEMPLHAESEYSFDMNTSCNQAAAVCRLRGTVHLVGDTDACTRLGR